jgi:hypothetical protein
VTSAALDIGFAIQAVAHYGKFLALSDEGNQLNHQRLPAIQLEKTHTLLILIISC